MLTAVVEQLALVLLEVSNNSPRPLPVLSPLYRFVVEYHVYTYIGSEPLEDLVDDYVLALKDIVDSIAGRNRDIRIHASVYKP